MKSARGEDMHARVSTYQFESARADEFVSEFVNAVSSVEEMQGERGAYLLVDRGRGKALTITLWEDEAALNASAAAADELRSSAAGQSESTIEAVESYEVALQQVR
jgi:heme-degrading monooxygenase HmoA